MLFGEHKHTLDAKNRLFVPAKFREVLSKKFIITRDIYKQKCLLIYSEEIWEKYRQILESIPNSEGKDLKRYVYRTLAHVEPDSQGRILLSEQLCKYAGIEKSVIFVGCGDFAEIWDEQTLEEQSDSEDTEAYFETLKSHGM